VRTGAYALSLLAEPVHIRILTALGEAPLSFAELSRGLRSVPHSTARRHLRDLTEIQVLDRARDGGAPGSRDYALTAAGRDLLAVATVLQAWLTAAPNGPLRLGSPAAKSAVKALDDAWSSAIVRALAARPLTLVELDSLIGELTYPQLERRLALMRRTGQIEACADGCPGRGRLPYTATEWLRRAIAPVFAAIRWERRRLPAATGAITRIDAEAVLLLAVPMLTLPAGLSGRCRLAIEVEHRGGSRIAGVMVEVDAGRIVSCTSRLAGDPAAAASGSGQAWLEAIIERRSEGLRLDGSAELATSFVTGLHELLFAPAPNRPAC
jgi:DNA-binding HxlR family transcriptional regulator